MKKILAASLLFLISGCVVDVLNYPYEKDFNADETFTPDERAQIIHHVSLLSKKTHTMINIKWELKHPINADNDGTDDCKQCIIRTNGTGGVLSQDGDLSPSSHLKKRPFDIITIGVSQPELIGSIAAHEIGHSIGLEHVKDTHSLMSEVLYDSEFIWSEFDQNECGRIGVCK